MGHYDATGVFLEDQEELSIEEILGQLDKRKVSKAIGIYFLFQDKTLVYIGQSQNVGQRVYAHLSEEKKQFDQVAVYECRHLSLSGLNELEARLILELRPIYNTTVPANVKYKNIGQLKKFLRGKGIILVNAWKLKKWIKDNDIKPMGLGYYKISDFEGMS